LAPWHNLKASIGKRLNDAFRELLGFVRVHSVVRVILARIANSGGDYRVHLMLVGHKGLPDL
jgi:hypothetical protein